MSNRSKPSKRRLKSRTSKRFCQENFACDVERVEAVFECEDCKTLQCLACETKLHEFAKLNWHDRHKLTPPSADELCEAACENRNFFDVKCQNCEQQFCLDCFEKLHKQGRKRNHKVLTAKELKQLAVQLAELEVKLTDRVESEQHDNAPAELQIQDHFYSLAPAPAILPSSPVGSPADQLTYVTKPQTRETEASAYSQMSATTSTGTDRGRSSRSSLPDIAIGAGHEGELNSDEFHTMYSTPESALHNLKLTDPIPSELDKLNNDIYAECRSFPLADATENLKVTSEEDFIRKLRCEADQEVKVVSIFGNTGDGKSHTLNHTFFAGKEIFKTSSHQTSCTAGVWAAYDPVHMAVIIDTEGLLGIATNQNQRTRLLLKVLAVSDVVIYRTKADRLHSDLFRFLGDAALAFSKHFKDELQAASKRLEMPLDKLGPSVVVFHETQHTEILSKEKAHDADRILRDKFRDLQLNIESFNSLKYVGVKTVTPPTDFQKLRAAVKLQLKDKSVRSPRKLLVIFNALKVLNEKFSGDIDKTVPSTFPDEYFTCQAKCLSCQVRCCRGMNHGQDNQSHHSDGHCSFQSQFENKVFKCKACCERGDNHVVVPKTASSKDTTWMALVNHAWSGYVLECPRCGIIYRSRQFWYGNEEPERDSVTTEIRHVWPGENQVLQGTHNAARRLLDGIQYVSESIAYVGAKPTKMVTDWVNDQIAPPYWVPNAQIKHCKKCGKRIGDERVEAIHHCRACGQGFCDDCSTKRRPVPERGWGPEPVRVCDTCYERDTVRESKQKGEDVNKVTPRYVSETISHSVGAVASVVCYPKDLILDSARPTYWVPNHQIKACCVCKGEFGPKLRIHHCRACGNGVCEECSPSLRPVPSRGWDHPVRVCNTCDKKTGRL